MNKGSNKKRGLSAKSKEKETRLEEENRQLKERLEALPAEGPNGPADGGASQSIDQGMLGDLVFGIAHQIRNPLAIIRSATESLMEAPGGGQSKQPYQAILNSAELLQDRLEQLIDFTRPIELGQELISVREIAGQMEKILSSRCRVQRVKLDRSISDRLPP